MAKEQIVNDKYFVYNGNNRKGSVIAEPVAKTLKSFCESEPEFEQAVRQSGKTFVECIDEVASTLYQYASDLEVYEKAVEFYFPEATISVTMTVNMSGKVEAEAAEKKPYKKPEILEAPPAQATEPKKSMTFSLDELLDF